MQNSVHTNSVNIEDNMSILKYIFITFSCISFIIRNVSAPVKPFKGPHQPITAEAVAVTEFFKLAKKKREFVYSFRVSSGCIFCHEILNIYFFRHSPGDGLYGQ